MHGSGLSDPIESTPITQRHQRPPSSSPAGLYPLTSEKRDPEQTQHEATDDVEAPQAYTKAERRRLAGTASEDSVVELSDEESTDVDKTQVARVGK